jgi:predicted nucleic acid-binding protein
MRAVLADTGPLYAAIDLDDANHARSQRDLGRLAGDANTIMIAFPTLLECYTLVLRRFPIQSAQRWLQEIRGGAMFVNPEIDDYTAATSTLQRYLDQPITLFDAVVAAVAVRLGVQVWTYDHHFDVMRTATWH